jgi:hypothetical protein
VRPTPVSCEVAGVIPRHCATCSRPSSTPRPSKRDGYTLEERTATDLMLGQDSVVTRGERSTSPPSPPTQCGHPQPCTTIPSAVEPFPTLWKPCSDGAPPCRPLYSTSAPVSKMYERRPSVDASRTSLEATPRRVRKPPRRLREPGFAGTSIKSQALYAGTTILYKKPCGTSVSCLPLAYKRRRRPPGRGHRITFHPCSLTHTHSLDIGTLPQSPSRDLEASPPLLPCL